ncbi:hypothetical protein [Geomonas anaerohicana]|uniref:Uncharacterized protein n=1 Tax=Geomonas anaerohicana TaxID=2798583 RepID=A0ABS0YGS2_9BACT|nr:hypothetical protein [Geomonas anaerohicana]MBJ6751462.1 hypothetical protein [Geomonas anaerohicana]
MEHNSLSLKLWCAALAALVVAVAVGYPHGAMLWRNLATPLAGEREVLPAEALVLVDLVRQRGVRSATLSPRIADNRFLAQPMTEAIYPALVKDGGELYVSYAAEALPPGCRLLQTVKGVSIAGCR